MYVMHRVGSFKASQPTKNQCRQYGFSSYRYHLTLVFAPFLNEQGFVIDHFLIDEVIQKTKLSGSCEQMHKTIYNEILNLCFKKNIRLPAYKGIIYPSNKYDKPEAWILYVMADSPLFFSYLNT